MTARLPPTTRRGAIGTALAGLAAATLPGCGVWRWPAQRPLGEPAEPPPPDLAPAAEPLPPTQLDALYQRGVQALARDDLDAAVAAWRAHVRGAPAGAARTLQLRGYLTLLQRESARRLAVRAATGEAAAGFAPGDRLRVAVLPFAERVAEATLAGAPPAAGFNRAVAAMVTVDLAKVPSLTVLEREKTDHLLAELALARSGLVDPAAQPSIGRLLGAGSVVGGTVRNEPGPAGPGSGRYRIDSAVSDVATRRTLGSQQADGLQAEFFRLQKRIVHGILDTLGVRDRPAAVDTVHTRSWAAYGRFARGLALQADGRWDEARAAFGEALALDPGFALAGESLADLPERALTLAEIRARVGAGR